MAEPTEWSNGALAFRGKLPDDIVAARSRYFKAARAAGRYNPDPVAAVFTRVVQDAGYDSVMIRAYAGDVSSEAFRNTGGNQLVVFDPRKVVVVDADAN